MTIRAIQEIPKDPAKRDLDEVERLVQACFASADYKEGRRAFMRSEGPSSRIASRSPRFADAA